MCKKIFSVILMAAILMTILGCLNKPAEDKPAEDKSAETEIIDDTVSAFHSETRSIAPAESEIPIVESEDVRYILKITNRYRTYDTIAELEEAATDIIIGTCVSSGAIFQNDVMYSLAEVRIREVIKGSQEIEKVILVLEPGGRTTMDEYSKNTNIPTKNFEAGGQSFPGDKKIVEGVDGYFPLKEGEKILLFLDDISGFIETINEPLYTVVGGYDGTLHMQKDAFKRPIPAETDNRIFEGSVLSIDMAEITDMVNENNEGFLKK